jgi:hypothetical protein
MSTAAAVLNRRRMSGLTLLEKLQLVADPEARFWAKVAKGADCWAWLGGTTRAYGNFGLLNGVTAYAHRVAWVLTHGEDIPDGHHLHHTCGTERCVRPEHLVPMLPEEHRAQHASRIQ